MNHIRPTYETTQDKSNEAVVAAMVAGCWDCWAFKLPRFYHADYALCRPRKRIAALMEIKCRLDVPVETYDSYMISVGKLVAINALASAMGVPAFLVVQWKDALRYCELTELLSGEVEFHIGGREDRGDPEDMEPIAYIPMDRFKPVK